MSMEQRFQEKCRSCGVPLPLGHRPKHFCDVSCSADYEELITRKDAPKKEGVKE